MSTPFGGNIRDPHEWMREQEQRTALLLAKAEDVQARLAQNTVHYQALLRGAAKQLSILGVAITEGKR